MHVLIVHCTKDTTPNCEYVSPEQVDVIRQCLIQQGWDVSHVRYDPCEVESLVEGTQPDVILNLAYGYSDNKCVKESQPDTARRLESTGINCVGAPSTAQQVAQDKVAVSERVESVGVCTPALMSKLDDSRQVYVLKPRYGACHRDVRLITADTEDTWTSSNEAFLVQEYVDGPEYTVGVIEVRGKPYAFPPLEVSFQCEMSTPHIMDWERYRWDYRLASEHQSKLRAKSITAFEAIGLRHYARFDFRVSAGEPILLDANALPNLDPQISLLPLIAKKAGWSYCRLINHIVTTAVERNMHE